MAKNKLTCLIRTHYPEKDDFQQRIEFKKKLKEEGKTPKEKIKEIFQEIGVDIDLDSMIEKGQ